MSDEFSFREHLDFRFEAMDRFLAERDRRITEVGLEREKALKIKEQADRDALQLAREIQTYKDEKANELRKQIESERGLYPTKDDVRKDIEKLEEVMKPILAYVAGQQGRSGGFNAGWGYIVGGVGLAVALASLWMNSR